MINYGFLAAAEKYYQNIGYELIEVPWVVSHNAYYTTKPKGAWDVVVGTMPDLKSAYPTNRKSAERDDDEKLIQAKELRGYLPASGEQSFLDVLFGSGGNFRGGKYVATTPCFRSETYDGLHKPWFMKTELIYIPEEFHEEQVEEVLSDAGNFFANHMSVGVSPVKTKEGIDWVGTKSSIELGSYGWRTYKGVRYIYGTGCAEPRLSYVKGFGGSL